MNVADFDYDLPESFIAQTPLEPRDSSKLMCLDRRTGDIEHHIFRDIVDYIHPNDVLVTNTTRVIPARLHGSKIPTGGSIEVLLLRQLEDTVWHVLVGGKKMTVGTQINFPDSDISAEIVEVLDEAERIIRFSQPVNAFLPQLGETPLPPYIHTPLSDPERYQTVYNRQEGSAAAPTAGLHFTPELLLALRQKGVYLASCVLHVGLDTFQPIRVEQVEQHHIHSEYALLSADEAQIINQAKLAGGRIIAVGTTTARTLETAAILSAGGEPSNAVNLPDFCPWRPVMAFERNTNLFIYPGYQWRAVDALITNFHLPRSTLLMMISAFADRENVLQAYEIAKKHHYRFFSFGDAMFIA
jgi:S-adenosylmethionine:tRNA ribosyltransferase-isomerase